MLSIPCIEPFLSNKTKAEFAANDLSLSENRGKHDDIEKDAAKLQRLAPTQRMDSHAEFAAIPKRRAEANIEKVQIQRKRISLINDTIIPEIKAVVYDLEVNKLPAVAKTISSKALRSGWAGGHQDSPGTLPVEALRRHPEYRDIQDKILNADNALFLCGEIIRKMIPAVEAEERKLDQLTLSVANF